MNFSTFIIPVRKTENSLSVLLEKRNDRLHCIPIDYPDDEFLHSVAEELDYGGRALQSVLLHELAARFGSVPLGVAQTASVRTEHGLSYYFLAFISYLPPSDHYVWVDAHQLQEVAEADGNALKKLFDPLPDPSVFAGATSSLASNTPVIAFDGGGVLFEWKDERFFKMMGEAFSCKAERFGEVFLGDWCRRALHTGEKTQSEIHAHLSKKLRPIPFLQYVKTYFESVRLIEKNLEIVQRLREKYPEIPFVITSNTNPIIEQVLLDHPVVKNGFSNYFISWRMKTVKPDAKFYKRVESVMNTKNILLVDDGLDNLESANTAGWHTYHTERNAELSFESLDNAVSVWLSK